MDIKLVQKNLPKGKLCEMSFPTCNKEKRVSVEEEVKGPKEQRWPLLLELYRPGSYLIDPCGPFVALRAS